MASLEQDKRKYAGKVARIMTFDCMTQVWLEIGGECIDIFDVVFEAAMWAISRGANLKNHINNQPTAL